MHVKWIKGLALLLAGGLCLLAPAGTAYANCNSPINQGLTSSLEQCGVNAAAFLWQHGRAVQRIIIAGSNAAANSAAGNDSGNLVGAESPLYTDGPNGAANGSYSGNTDFNNPGYDGCIFNNPEGAAGCGGGQDFGVLDYALSGVDPAFPNVAKLVVLSVDFNELFQQYFLDNAGAPSVDGNPCGGDALSGHPGTCQNPGPNVGQPCNTPSQCDSAPGAGDGVCYGPINCGQVPVPAITGSAAATGGSNITISVASITGIPFLDDCNIAETKATNCPRNLYVNRQLFYRHGACTASTGAAFDKHAFTYPAQPASGTLTTTGNWTPYSVEDANLNGTLDAGEDGTHGGAVNGVLDPFLIPGTAAASVPVFVPAVTGASDCIFFAIGIQLDANHLALGSPATGNGETVIAPQVSVNTNPIRAGSATPVSDVVSLITASKSQGKGTVNWETGVELTTAGFNLIGAKKGGNNVQLNSSLIAAKEGTTGKGASYSVTLDASQMKGSTLVYVEIVKTDGSKERFGPASF